MALKLRIRELREDKGLSGKELAAIVGVSAPHLSEVERGKKNVNNHLLERIAEALEVEEKDLIASEAEAKWSNLLKTLDELSSTDQARVVAFADSLKISQSN